MTERLYYRDSYLRAFDAQVLSCEQEGERWKVKLDRTAFYPTSGGQPHDTGTLGGVAVVEVAEGDAHTVVHYTSAALPAGGVHGEVDWSRRIDHMHQHTGQHLLSAVFIELFGFQTVSFHLGREISTIDLDTPSIVARQVEEAEWRTNQIIFDDRVIGVRFGTAEELAEAGIRKSVEREGVLRAIEIEGVDRQPCGGTHLARTGQAGLLLVRKTERRRDVWRIEFVCGYRALGTARADYAVLTRASALLTCGIPDLPGMLGKTIAERRAQYGGMKRLEERLAEHESRALLASHSAAAGRASRVICSAIDDATPNYLKLLAAKLCAEAGVVALLASRSAGHVAFAQAKGGNGDMGSLLRHALEEFDGKGGGSKDFAQGCASDPSKVEQLLARAREKL